MNQKDCVPDMQKLLSLIGFARKAGKLTIGCELVLASVRSGKKAPKLVIAAKDAAGNTLKRVQNTCGYYEIPYCIADVSTESLGKISGKQMNVAVVGIADSGFAAAAKKHLPCAKADKESVDSENISPEANG